MQMTGIRIVLPAVGMVLILAAMMPASTQAVEPDESEQTALLEAMEGLKTHLKATAMALQSKSRPDALKHVAEMQRLVLIAKLEPPANFDETPEEERAAHRTAFRKDLILLLKALADMEIDILDGDYQAAFGHVVDPLYPMREAAHEKYQKQK